MIYTEDIAKAIAMKSECKKLVFAYIREYGCLDKVNLNFCHDFDFAYDPVRKELNVISNRHLPPGFWPDGISSVSAIVGKNGSGKSTAIRWILERVTEGAYFDKLGGIIAIQEGDAVHVYHDVPIKEIAGCDNCQLHKISTDENGNQRFEEGIKIPVIYSSGHFSISRNESVVDKEFTGERNISDRWLLVNDLGTYMHLDVEKLDKPIGDHIEAFYIENNLRICELLLDSQFHSTFGNPARSDVHIPRYIIFKPNLEAERNIRQRIEYLKVYAEMTDDPYYEKAKRQYGLLKDIEKIPYNSDIEKKKRDQDKSEIARFLYTSLQNYYYKLSFVEFLDDGVVDNAVRIFKNEYVNSTRDALGFVDEIVDNLDSYLSKGIPADERSRRSVDYISRYFRKLSEVLQFLHGKLQWVKGAPVIDCHNLFENKSEQIKDSNLQNKTDADKPSILNSLQGLMRPEEFITGRFFDLRYAHSIGVHANLSSGELALLNLYSRIKRACDEEMPGGNPQRPYLLLLDEVEMSFHPEWQRRFVNRLLTFLSLLAKDSVNSFQVIYTTHSPITLSDMPKECVNLMDEGKRAERKMETFGSNVFDLYGDSFFMNSGLVGEFASGKIKSLVSEIDESVSKTSKDRPQLSAEHTQQLVERIEMIGDVRIRQYLISRMELISPELEIKRLERQIEELRKEYGINEEN